MKTESKRTCPSCGNELSGAMEFCPVCMLRKGLAGGVESGESSVSEDMVGPAPEQSRQRFEHYELVTGEDGKPVELGRGAMGVTYKAFDVNLRCTVTLKVINEKYLGDESARLRFLREARAAASVRHSNVASVVHLGIRDQDYFYAMEFVEGEALSSLIERSGHLEVKLALEIATQVAAGLAAVHKQKLVHRDIKPGNIMVSFEDGGGVTAKIIDLGLAKTIHEAGSKTAISIPGWFAGTPEFASPEQFAGVGVDIRSDLYSLGVTLWEMVVGRVPFRGSPGEIMYQHQHAPLPLEQLRDFPQPVAVLIGALLEKDPAKRFQNPAELLKAMPTIIGAVDARRTITRQSFQKMLPTGLEFEHYQLLRNADDSIMELGRGSMGVTYKAFDTNLHSYVALKVITANLLESENAAERFLREARAAACLRHRNVASVFHLGRHGDSYFYAMEFIDGETVFSRVERDGPLDCLFGLEIAQQVACALIAAEEQQLVHRDIKPSNLMLVRESDGEILTKVIDFGIAKSSIRESTAAGALTIKGFVGSPYFASPEQLDRRLEDIRSDIYSLGVTLWYMLTGKPTFMGSMASVIAQHLEKAPAFESLALLPAQVVTVLRRMLEKDMTKRIQTPSQLRVELRHCIESVAALQAASRPKGAINEHFETIAFSTAQIPVVRPESGSQLKNRYRLIEDVDPANPRHTFHAEDIVARMRVTVRIFAAEASIQKQIDEEADRIKGASHPNFVHVFSVEREGSFSFVVLEWLEGLQLVDLLRARRGLTLREMLMLLEQIAPAVDAAREASLRLEMNLSDILVHFPESFAEPTANVLLRCPLDEWPTFVVKMSLLGRLKELEASVQLAEGQTIVSDLKPQRDVFQLGALVYELLGGKHGGFSPLTNISEKGNEVLRNCLTSGRGFSTACEFCDALAGTANAGSGRVAKIQKVPEPERLPAARLDPPPGTVARPAPTSRVSPSRPIRSTRHHAFLFVGVLSVITLAGGLILVFGPPFLNQTPRPTPQPLAAPHSAQSTTAFDLHQSLQLGKPWTNSLKMRFVPLGDVYIAVWQTRVSDFEAFVRATGYDAVGGMLSAVTQNGFKLSAMSWQAPGFPQTPDDPVVGVSWEDANQFCAWLTKKEQSEGTLAPFQSYRLVTDREWSHAVGIDHEQGATPEERSGKLRGLYPWGNEFPPPNDVANYAGSESRAGAPETWAVIPAFHDAFPRTAPVSAFKANARGLCCLGGNVWEWCRDKFNGTMNWRTLRGGSWATSRAEEMLSSYRRGYGPLFRCDDVGFRCVVAPDGAHE